MAASSRSNRTSHVGAASSRAATSRSFPSRSSTSTTRFVSSCIGTPRNRCAPIGVKSTWRTPPGLPPRRTSTLRTARQGSCRDARRPPRRRRRAASRPEVDDERYAGRRDLLSQQAAGRPRLGVARVPLDDPAEVSLRPREDEFPGPELRLVAESLRRTVGHKPRLPRVATAGRDCATLAAAARVMRARGRRGRQSSRLPCCGR